MCKKIQATYMQTKNRRSDARKMILHVVGRSIQLMGKSVA